MGYYPRNVAWQFANYVSGWSRSPRFFYRSADLWQPLAVIFNFLGQEDANTAPQRLGLNCQCCPLQGVLEVVARPSLSMSLIGLRALKATSAIFVRVQGPTPLHVRSRDSALEF